MKKIITLLFAMLWCGLSAAQTMSPLEALFQSSNEEEPLPPDEAFQLQLVRDPVGDGFIARWEIAENYYLYREKIKITSSGQEVMINTPAGEEITDEFFGTTQVFRHQVQVPFQLSAATGDVLEVRYQGCADLGICYPPITQQIALADINDTSSNAILPNAPTLTLPISEQAQIAERLGNQSLLVIIAGFLGFGLLLAFTPCVLPMIPIVSGMISGSGSHLSTHRAFTLTLFYVLAMALTYAVAGVLIGFTGASLQIWFQNPVIISIFAAIFVLLALSMFGLYQLRIPAAIQNRMSQAGSEQKGSLVGAGIMGSASALIVGPCVTPPLVGTLLFIAQTGSATTGGIALFSFGIGMGIPLLAVGTSLGKWLPQPGPLLEHINVLFGVLLLGVAIWLVDRVVAPVVTQLLASVLLIGAAVYFLRPKQPLVAGLYFWRGLGAVMIIYGAMLLVGAMAGGSSFLAPLKPFVQGDHAAEQSVAFTRVNNLADLQQQLHTATQAGLPAMLDFYADWCVTCKEMEAFTFNKAPVQQALSSFVLFQADVTKNTADDRRLLEYFGIFGPPAILFFDPSGKELHQARLVGFVAAKKFLAHIKQVHRLGSS